jgi:thioester reductase-like protein
MTRNVYRRILVTGATGFIGCHLLKALLMHSDAEIVCTVRRASSVAAGVRLRALFCEYFGHEHTALFDMRCRVFEVAPQHSNLGLQTDIYGELTHSCDAIFHFAADTRLFANPGDVTEANVEGTQAAITFAKTGRPKHLHYMSTLAVAGINPRPHIAQFTERDLDIGQEFQNAYELSKYRSEKMLKAHINDGGQAYIYRAGNVSGHSQTGRFSRSGADNRIVQILRAIVDIGCAPMSTTGKIALTPVDDVVDACLIIASDPAAVGGVYHLDNGVSISWTDLFSALRQEGLAVEPTSKESLRALFSEPAPVETQATATARLWVNRSDRNVQFDSRHTQSVLSRQGFTYHDTDWRWLTLLVRDLVANGFLVPVVGAALGGSGRPTASLHG